MFGRGKKVNHRGTEGIRLSFPSSYPGEVRGIQTAVNWIARTEPGNDEEGRRGSFPSVPLSLCGENTAGNTPRGKAAKDDE